MNKNLLRKLPGIDRIIAQSEIQECIRRFGHGSVVFVARKILEDLRGVIINSESDIPIPSLDNLVTQVVNQVTSLMIPSLKRVINATGVILHTNLGRAPLGKSIIKDLARDCERYTNLEFELKTGKRGQRNFHITSLLKFLVGSEDVIVVNNNAAAIFLVLNTLAKNKEVIISRGELIEIGGSFRLPEIMAASGARMIEVGTTNRTRLSDYAQAIGPDTAMLFKAHKSNFNMCGFTEEVGIKALAQCAHSHGLSMFYDIGSGLLRKPGNLPLEDEPDVQGSLKEGADLVAFSGDKLFGGPQAGIIAGKKEYIQKCAKAPLMRALRVGKMTLSALTSACRYYSSNESLIANIPLFKLIEQPLEEIQARADKLCQLITTENSHKTVEVTVVECNTQVGGGSLPDLFLPGKAVMLELKGKPVKIQGKFAETIYYQLLHEPLPIISFLKEGRVMFNCSTIFADEIEVVGKAVVSCLHKL